jgi:hypothetical protein
MTGSRIVQDDLRIFVVLKTKKNSKKKERRKEEREEESEGGREGRKGKALESLKLLD